MGARDPRLGGAIGSLGDLDPSEAPREDWVSSSAALAELAGPSIYSERVLFGTSPEEADPASSKNILCWVVDPLVVLLVYVFDIW